MNHHPIYTAVVYINPTFDAFQRSPFTIISLDFTAFKKPSRPEHVRFLSGSWSLIENAVRHHHVCTSSKISKRRSMSTHVASGGGINISPSLVDVFFSIIAEEMRSTKAVGANSMACPKTGFRPPAWPFPSFRSALQISKLVDWQDMWNVPGGVLRASEL